MEKIVTKTVDALSKFGERIERRLSTGDDDCHAFGRYGSPFDQSFENQYHSSSQRDGLYGGMRNFSSDNLAIGPGFGGFNNYGQNSMGVNPYANGGMIRPPYGNGIGGPVNFGVQRYPSPSPGGSYGVSSGNVGYAPDYYIAERRQYDLVPAPRPQYIRQQVPVPVPVDRPVPQPYPVQVPQPYPVDRPVPVPVPSPVPFERRVPVPVAVPVPVPSPPPPPVQVPVPVPVPVPSPVPFERRVPVPVQVPCYVPVGVPVPSPPPSPRMVENSVTHTQRWVTGSSTMGMNSCANFCNGPFAY